MGVLNFHSIERALATRFIQMGSNKKIDLNSVSIATGGNIDPFPFGAVNKHLLLSQFIVQTIEKLMKTFLIRFEPRQKKIETSLLFHGIGSAVELSEKRLNDDYNVNCNIDFAEVYDTSNNYISEHKKLDESKMRSQNTFNSHQFRL